MSDAISHLGQVIDNMICNGVVPRVEWFKRAELFAERKGIPREVFCNVAYDEGILPREHFTPEIERHEARLREYQTAFEARQVLAEKIEASGRG